MYCIECKARIFQTFSFCQNCGIKINFENLDIKSNVKVAVNIDIDFDGKQQESKLDKTSGSSEFDHDMDPEFNKKFDHTICREFRGQAHFRPKPDTVYWSTDKPKQISDVILDIDEKKPSIINQKRLVILIPFYNEEASELMLTLNSIYPDFASIKAMGYDIHILLVMDGWWKASESMKKLMQDFFKCNRSNHLPWWETIKPIKPTDDLADCVSTFILQRLTAGGESISQINIGDRSLKISLVVKRDNRRKINAHDWMLSSFADFYKAEFVFLTDCGTLFERKCLTLLVRELLKRPDCTAVSGRQRVMSSEQQGSDECCCISYEAFLRAAQRFDYESSLASFVGGFSLFGMLPVIPGPCGLYRYEAIRKDCVPYYINSVAAHPSECGILLANLNLAEDRVLSYAAVLKTHKNAYTCYVPEAVFYFAAETIPLQLFQQRRRWINGTIAGYIWLLSKPSIIWDSGLRPWNKPLLSLLLLCQLFMYLGVGVSPGIFVTSFYWSLLWIDNTFMSGNFETYKLCEIIYALYLIMYVAFAIRHANPDKKPPLSTKFVKFVTFANMLAMIVILLSMGSGLKIMYDTRSGIWADTGSLDLNDIVVLFVLFTIFGPLFLALLHSFTSFIYLLRSIVQFYLLLPTTVTYIGVYALSRVWDLSWGNRPSEKSSLKATLSVDQQNKNAKKIQKIGRQIAFGLILLNGLVAFLLLQSKQRRIYILMLAIFIFAWTNIQMLFSGMFFIGRNTRRLFRLSSRWCCVRLCKCYTKREWYTGTKN